MEIDSLSVEQILRLINVEDGKVATAVGREIPHIVKAVDLVVDALWKGGRLIYVGAGTSGRLGVLDAVECPPTYGTDPRKIQGLIAGGREAMFKAQEGAEDKEENGAKDIDDKNVTSADVVCGIAASLRTPYVAGALKQAKKRSASTVLVTANPRLVLNHDEFKQIANAVDVAICPDVGPEVIMGSTRMKSGTAQKLVLNMITTTAMIRLGKVYENMMVDLQMTNEKLKERAKRVIMTITNVSYEAAERVLNDAGGHVKTALVMQKAGVARSEAEERLRKANGFVRAAIERRQK
jgi:N-acetylmuramic acid 6-phosphate etherase